MCKLLLNAPYIKLTLLLFTGAMASASDIPVHFPIPTPCNLCEDDEDVNSFCKECHQYLCDRCNRLHAKSPFLKNHTIVPYAEGYKIKSDQGDHSVVCKDHNEIFVVFCRQCNGHVCSKCLASKGHKGHDFTDLNTYADEIIERIMKKIGNATTKNEAMLNEMSKIEMQNNEAIKQCEQDIIAVRNRVATLIDEARTVESELTGLLQKRKEELKQHNEKMKDNIQSAAARNERHYSEVANNVQLQSNISVVSFETVAVHSLKQMELIHPLSSGGIRFSPSNFDIARIKDIIGKIESEKIQFQANKCTESKIH